MKEGSLIIKDDAASIANAKKSAYIKEKALEYIVKCFITIREEANKMRFKADVQVSNVEFSDEIIQEIAENLKKVGYIIQRIGESNWICIYWRELTEQEKENYKQI